MTTGVGGRSRDDQSLFLSSLAAEQALEHRARCEQPAEIVHPSPLCSERKVRDELTAQAQRLRPGMTRTGRVGVWRGGGAQHICCRPFRLAVPHWFDRGSVSTPRSSNRTCRFAASGSRTRHHAFTHDGPRSRARRAVRRRRSPDGRHALRLPHGHRGCEPTQLRQAPAALASARRTGLPTAPPSPTRRRLGRGDHRLATGSSPKPCARHARAGCRAGSNLSGGIERSRAPALPRSHPNSRPRQLWLMRPAGSTAVCSTTSRPAPDTDSEPRCWRCQSLADPSTALYWHIGETAIRFASVTPPRVIGSNRRLARSMDMPLWSLLLSPRLIHKS